VDHSTTFAMASETTEVNCPYLPYPKKRNVPTHDDITSCLRVLKYMTNHVEDIDLTTPPWRTVFQKSQKFLKSTQVNRYKESRPGIQKERIKRAKHFGSYVPESTLDILEVQKDGVSDKRVSDRDGVNDTNGEGGESVMQSNGSNIPLLSLPKFLRPEQFKSRDVRLPKCYICKDPFPFTHEFYDQMCLSCGEFNMEKRMQKADFSGWVAIVTGARIKIGFEIALKLLRCECQVIATTRFTKDAFLRFSHEPDFESFRERLKIEYLELGSFQSISQFVTKIKKTYTKIDLLINNAAQTLHRSEEFYTREQHIEQVPSKLLQCEQIVGTLGDDDTSQPRLLPCSRPVQELMIDGNTTKETFMLSNGSSHPSQITRDEYGQPIDTSPKNSWVMSVQDIPIQECIEVHLVNAIAPFVLIQQLLPVMDRKKTSEYSHIINVTSMEGSFSKINKSGCHVHTNMAKASMNMITRTSGPSFLKHHRILMNSVDTGWIDEMIPWNEYYHRVIPIPLDVIDGAARVLDPVMEFVNRKQVMAGVFFKDYKVSNW
jgi:NAD(P)-dependent dehydrogenase (short-subunit alcohol dehydrogenase family)